MTNTRSPASPRASLSWRPGMPLKTKTSVKIDTLDMNTLFHDDLGRKHGIETTGDLGNSPGIFGRSVVSWIFLSKASIFLE